MERVWTGVIGSSIALLLAAYFTRAGRCRIAGALSGGVAAAIANIAVDIAAHAAGLWRYPDAATPYAPLWFYSGALMGIAAIALGIWRLDRRYGGFGVAAALATTAILFPIRDFRVASTTNVIEFGDGIVPWLADGVAAVVVVGVGVIVMRLVAGPATADALVER